MKLVIDRKTWLRGEGGDKSKLIRSSDNKMCCLGFLGKACNIKTNSLRDISAPNSLNTKWPRSLYSRIDRVTHQDHASKLMAINDNPLISDEKRELTLKDAFSQINIDVEFID